MKKTVKALSLILAAVTLMSSTATLLLTVCRVLFSAMFPTGMV